MTGKVPHEGEQQLLPDPQPKGTRQPPLAGPDTHVQEAAGLQAVLLAPQQQLQPFQAPVGALQRVRNICSEKRQGEALPRVRPSSLPT